MAKRRSSKTKAQSDPTISEDQNKDSIASIDAETTEEAKTPTDQDTLTAAGDSGEDIVGQTMADDAVGASESDDTIVAQDASDESTSTDTADSSAGQEEGISDTAHEGDDSVVKPDAEDTGAPLESNDSVSALSGEDNVISDETLEDSITDSYGQDSTEAATGDEAVDVLAGDTVALQDDAAEGADGDASTEPETPTQTLSSSSITETRPEPAPEPKPRTIMPMILGGFIAALLGFVAARTEILDSILPAGNRAEAPVAEPAAPAFDDSKLTSQLDALSTQVSDLATTVAALPAPQAAPDPQPAPEVDLSGIETEIAALKDQITKIANQPVVEAPVPTEALDAALAELRKKASEQQSEIDKLLADQKSTINNAEKAAKATLARTAMTAVQTAINAGAPYDAALGELSKTGLVEVPQGLSDTAVDGVASLAELQESLPDAAREALYAARDAQTGSGLTGFIQLQLGTRSVEAREGSDPDAILSRIEADTRAGDLDSALTEAKALPAPAQDAMSTWIEKAQSRHNAVLAANALAERLSAL